MHARFSVRMCAPTLYPLTLVKASSYLECLFSWPALMSRIISGGCEWRPAEEYIITSSVKWFPLLDLCFLWPSKRARKCVLNIRDPKETKQVFGRSFPRKMAYVTSFGLKLPGPLHPVAESLPSHQSRKNPLPSGMFKHLAFLLSPWLRC